MVVEIEQTALFDYASLDNDTREFVQEKAANIHARLKRTAEDIIAIGKDLIEVKTELDHGQFIPWLKSEFGMSIDTAQDFMRVARRFGSKNWNFQHFPTSVLYELASPSIPDTIIEQVESGQIPATLPAIREAKQEAQEIVDYDRSQVGYKYEDRRFALQDTYTPPDATSQLLQGTQIAKEAYEAAIEDRPLIISPDRDRIEDIQREIRREQQRERIAELKEKGVFLPTGKFSCIVIDPPWQMQKIERDVRPNQVEFDYPTMSEDELKAFSLPDFAADDCHMYLWTTQKHLPMALRLAEYWGFKYQCLMTWVKNVGFTPFSWMYSTEHVLFCTKGSLPLLRLGMRLDFHAKVREHSRKPDEFYDIVREVSPVPRIDVFSREKRDGFEQYGNEVEKYVY